MCWMAASAAAGEACASGRMVRPEMVTTCVGEVLGTGSGTPPRHGQQLVFWMTYMPLLIPKFVKAFAMRP